jgi:DNA-binding transcriptional regulator YdaS (Cro superfamily)
MPVEKVAEVFGGNSRLAEVCGRSRAAPRYWPNGVPAEHVLAVEAASKGKLSRHDLRPDIYPRERKKSRNGAAKSRKRH